MRGVNLHAVEPGFGRAAGGVGETVRDEREVVLRQVVRLHGPPARAGAVEPAERQLREERSAGGVDDRREASPLRD